MGRNHKNRSVSEIDSIRANKNFRQKKLRVAAYSRVSTDSSDQENSLKNQKDHYETTILANPNWEYAGFYVDNGGSGTKTCNRKEFNRMLDDCKKGKIDLIVAKDVFRFANNIVDCLNTVELLLNNTPPIGVIFEDNNLNTLDANDKVVIEIFALLTEYENELKRKQKTFWREYRTQNK
jgi:DNA invertase Pin-like site-specific DNA recombinase